MPAVHTRYLVSILLICAAETKNAQGGFSRRLAHLNTQHKGHFYHSRCASELQGPFRNFPEENAPKIEKEICLISTKRFWRLDRKWWLCYADVKSGKTNIALMSGETSMVASRAVMLFLYKEALNKSLRTTCRKISRPTSLKNLVIHPVFLRFFASRGEKFSRQFVHAGLGHV